MKRNTLGRTIAAGVMGLVLCGPLATAESQATTARAPARTAARHSTARKNVEFKSEKTDSWLCLYVSPLFCSNLVPSLQTNSSGDAPQTTGNVPDRGRH